MINFHGNINLNSVIGIEEQIIAEKGKKKRFYIPSSVTSIKNNSEEIVDFYDFKFRLIYHHLDKISIEEWVDHKLTKLQTGSK